MGTDTVFAGVPPVNVGLILNNASGTTAQSLYIVPNTASDKGFMLGRLRATTDDTTAVTLQFSAVIGANEVILGESQVPIGAGTNSSTVWKNILDDLSQSLPMDLAPGTQIKVKAKTTITSGKVCHLFMSGAPLA